MSLSRYDVNISTARTLKIGNDLAHPRVASKGVRDANWYAPFPVEVATEYYPVE
jgi:hypothetical protein